MRRSFACVSLVVFAETYLDPKYGSIPGDLVEFSSCSAGMIPPTHQAISLNVPNSRMIGRKLP